MTTEPKPSPPKEIRIVFDGPPGPQSGRFVEVEDEHGRSMSVGTWRKRSDGLHELALSFDPADLREAAAHGGLDLRTVEADIYDHHDGYGLNEQIRIFKNAPGPGGASHRYRLAVDISGTDRAIESGCTGQTDEDAGFIQFQRGPRHDPDSTPGVTEGALIAVLLDRLRAFQRGDYSTRENSLAITKLEEALHWLKARAFHRAKRGVLGTTKV